MRKITLPQILIFLSTAMLILAGAGCLAHWLGTLLPLGIYQVLVVFFLFLILTTLFSLFSYRLFLWMIPLKEGVIEHDSKEEWIYHIHLLFYLLFFHPIIRGQFLPIPFMRLYFQALGATLGKNTFSSGMLLDGIFIKVGSNTLIGQGSILTPHAIENDRLAHYPITIGSNVTVGANSTILPGVTIEDGAIVSAGALVKKGSHIGKGEIWGGVPAKKITTQDF